MNPIMPTRAFRNSTKTIIYGCFVVIFIAGCAHNSQITWKIDNRDELKTVLQERIPRGTPVAAAQQLMEKEGFTCTPTKNGVFVERQRWQDKEPLHEGIDFLYCYRRQNAGNFMMVRKTDVAVVLDQGVVKDVLVSCYVDGP
jgi:hypothetical protein